MDKQEEEQEYITKYCKHCKKDRVFITSVSPRDSLICCVCGHRESMVPFKMVKGLTGYKLNYNKEFKLNKEKEVKVK